MVQGGVPPMRPDQALQGLSRSGTGPAPQSTVFIGRLVIVSGLNGGEFVYNAARTQLESSNVGQATVDPVLGISCPQGFTTYTTFGKVISLLSTANDAFFQYANTGANTQGVLITAVSSSAGVDPVTGAAYLSGLYGVDPFGNFTNVVGSGIAFSTLAFTRSAGSQVLNPADAAHQPNWKLDAPEDTTASHAEIELFGASPDGTTKPAQMVVSVQAGNAIGAAVTNALLEVQGLASLTTHAAPAGGVSGAVFYYANTSGVLATVTQSGMFLNVSGAELADITAHTVTAASLTTITTAWSIPAGDAVASSIYRVQARGHGTQGTTAQNLFLAGAVAGGTFLAEVEFPSTAIGISVAFVWEATMDVVVKTSGAGGTVDISMQASVGFGAVATLGLIQGGQSRASGFNTTTAETVAIQAQWGSTTGAPTITCDENWIERVA